MLALVGTPQQNSFAYTCPCCPQEMEEMRVVIAAARANKGPKDAAISNKKRQGDLPAKGASSSAPKKKNKRCSHG